MILSSVLQQPAGVDYGVFVIAFAVNILNGFAETRKRFDVGKIRSHPLKCLEEEEFTLFLRIHKHTKLSKRCGFYIDIYVAHSMKKITKEMKVCLWQNVLNVVNGTTKNFLACF